DAVEVERADFHVIRVAAEGGGVGARQVVLHGHDAAVVQALQQRLGAAGEGDEDLVVLRPVVTRLLRERVVGRGRRAVEFVPHRLEFATGDAAMGVDVVDDDLVLALGVTRGDARRADRGVRRRAVHRIGEAHVDLVGGNAGAGRGRSAAGRSAARAAAARAAPHRSARAVAVGTAVLRAGAGVGGVAGAEVAFAGLDRVAVARRRVGAPAVGQCRTA